jgi:Tfp pilus assembly protein PilN
LEVPGDLITFIIKARRISDMTEMTRAENIKSIATASTERIRRISLSLRRILTYTPFDNLILPKKTVSASIEDGALSVAYCLRTFSKIYLKGTKKFPFQDGRYPQPKDVTSSLALSLNEFGISGPEITLAIPKAWIVLRAAEFPSTIRENIAGVIAGEMDRLTPFSADEALFDFRVLREDGERLTLVVMAVRASLVMPYINDLKESGYNVSRITASISGLGALYQHTNKNADNIIVEAGDNEYVGSLFIDGFLRKTLSGVLKPGDDEAGLVAVSECVRVLSDTADQEGISPEIVALFSENRDTLKGLFESRMERQVRSMEGIDTKLEFSGPADEIPFAATGCAVQSMWPDSQGYNLLNKGIREREKTPVVLSLILIIALIFTWIFYMAYPIKLEGKRLESISEQINLKRDEAREVEALKKEIDTIASEIATLENFKEELPMRIDIVKELTNIIPDGSYLTKLRITKETVEIEGNSGSAIELLPKLDASGYFAKVEFTSPTIRDANKNTDRFRIKIEIEKEKDKATETADDTEE